MSVVKNFYFYSYLYQYFKSVARYLKSYKLKRILKYKNHFIFCCLLYLLWKLRNFTQRRYKNLIRINPNKKYLKTSFGNIAYIANNPINKKPKDLVILIHGFSGCSENMKKLSDVLVYNKYSVICFDCYGRGCSDATEYPNSPEVFCSMISQALFTLQVKKKIHIVGYSMGGIIAGEFCKTFPHMVNTLTLLAPAGIDTHLPFVVRYCNFFPLGEIFVSMIGYMLLKKHYKECSGKKTIATDKVINLRKYHHNMKGYYSSLLSSLRNMPWEGYDYSSIKVRTYLIYSDADDIIDINKDNLCQFGEIEWEKMPGMSHSQLVSSKIGDRIVEFIEVPYRPII